MTRRPAASNLEDRIRAGAVAAGECFAGVEDDDYRVYFLAVLDRLDWTKTDDRWRSALELLQHDQPGDRDPIGREMNRLLVEITEQANDMIELRGEYADREDLHDTACSLRTATDRLHAIVYALTAVHSLGSAES
jgi:hypothetical protein